MEHSPINDLNYIINFSLLEHFKNLYSEIFTPIELPYIIEEKYVEVTLPPGHNHLRHKGDLVYVGSAEQSFIKYLSEGKLPKNNYQAITICSRDEKILNTRSLLNFVKLELFSKTISPIEMTKLVFKIYKNYDNRNYSIIETSHNCFDINCENVEVCSFGERFNPYSNSSFTFGTGLALPRFTTI